MYEEAERLSAQMGMEFQVVHDIPLRGRVVCGLHIPENLRVASDSWRNLRKFSTKRAEKELEEWLRERGLWNDLRRHH